MQNLGQALSLLPADVNCASRELRFETFTKFLNGARATGACCRESLVRPQSAICRFFSNSIVNVSQFGRTGAGTGLIPDGVGNLGRGTSCSRARGMAVALAQQGERFRSSEKVNAPSPHVPTHFVRGHEKGATDMLNGHAPFPEADAYREGAFCI